MADPAVLGMEGFKWVKEANTVAKTLYRKTEASGYAALKFDGVDYQIPATKKFIILNYGMSFSTNTTGYAEINIHEHTVASAAGGTEKYSYFTPNQGGFIGVIQMPCYIEIAAGNYINTYHFSAYVTDWVTGIECDA